MSTESGGSSSQSTGSGTAACDVPYVTNSVQESEHEITNSHSLLAVSQSESLSQLLYQSLSPQSSTTGRVSATSLHVREDGYEQEHRNEDATQYSRQSSEGSSRSQDTLQDQEARTTPQSSEDEDLPMPHQAEDTDSAKLEMVMTNEYSSDSLISSYLLIRNREETVSSQQFIQPSDPQPLGDNTTSDTSADATQLFAMDDDEEPTQGGAVNTDDSLSALASRFSVNFASKTSAIPNPSSAVGTLSDQPKLKGKAYTGTPLPVAVPSSTGYIDQADVHRDTTNNLVVANIGGMS